MRKVRFIIFILTLTSLNTILAQSTKKEYVKFMRNGIEFQTNGKDTICIVEPMPEFSGGKSKMTDFLRENLIYPKKALKEKIEGVVVLSFLVDKTGEIKNIYVKKHVRDDLDKEAIRVVKKMPRWKAGEQNGKPIPVQFSIPITFKIE